MGEMQQFSASSTDGDEMTTFEITTMVMMGLTLAGVGGIILWIFNFGRWVGMVDAEIEGNRADHMRYEETFQRMG